MEEDVLGNVLGTKPTPQVLEERTWPTEGTKFPTLKLKPESQDSRGRGAASRHPEQLDVHLALGPTRSGGCVRHLLLPAAPLTHKCSLRRREVRSVSRPPRPCDGPPSLLVSGACPLGLLTGIVYLPV